MEALVNSLISSLAAIGISIGYADAEKAVRAMAEAGTIKLPKS